MLTPDQCNTLGAHYLPGHLGIVITHPSASEVRSELLVKQSLALFRCTQLILYAKQGS